MANRRAVANGNWSALATWDGGVSLPGTGDDVYTNNFTVTVDQNVDVTLISNAANAGASAAAGGGLSVASANRTIDANLSAAAAALVTITTGANGGTTTIVGNVTATATGACVTNNSNGALAVTGNVQGGTTGAGIVSTNGGSVSVTGNATGGTGAGGHAISLTTVSATCTVVGTITGGGNGTANGVSLASTAGLAWTFNHSGGNIIGGTAGVGVQGGTNAASIVWNINATSLTGGSVQHAVSALTDNQSGTIAATTIGGPNAASGSGIGINLGGASCNVTINATNINGGQGGATAAGIGLGHSSGTVTMTAAMNSYTGVAVNVTGNGTVVANGNVTCNGIANGFSISGASCTVTINGNIVNATVTASTYALNIASNAPIVTVNGDATGSSNASNSGGGNGIHTTSAFVAGSLTLNGTATGGIGALCFGVNMLGIGATYYIRSAKGNNYPNSGILNACQGVQGGVNCQCTLATLEFGSGGVAPVTGVSARWFIDDAAVNSVKMRQSNAGTITTMGDVAADYPSTANVRDGTSYNFGGMTGTLKVPSPSSVAFGALTDNTTGTAVLTEQNVADAVGPVIAAAS